LEAEPSSEELPSSCQPGEVTAFSSQGFNVATGKGVLLIKEVHLEAAKAMTAKSFLAGHKIEKGMRFSSQ